ncbi:MAG: alpha/beta fold hydrolase, partial [Anaerolineae bacterium]|nr:alpha/beta fold hydrolase [Anaerolineae bacterium]
THMATFKVGIIGCGRPWRTEGAAGFGMGHLHAAGYLASPDCELVAAADINCENLSAFCEKYKIPHGYLDADEMFAKEQLDIVSICLWPRLHAPMVSKAVQAGVKAIHCEKPMAPTFGEARRMVELCTAHNVVLTINHQRRFAQPFRKAKELLNSGAIGRLERIEAFAPNLYDWGTHWFDMMFFYNDETPVEWVIGQIDARGGYAVFGVVVEGQGLSLFKWRNGVTGLMVTGERGLYERGEPSRSLSCGNRLIGSEGVIEVDLHGGPVLRLRNEETGGRWQEIEVQGGIHDDDLHVAAVLDLVDALKNRREPELAGRKALQATELIFATYESSRRRGRVDLPLDVEDSPFLSMLNAADITTWPAADITANGIRIHYYRTGRDRPPLVLAHGFSDNGLCWTPVARALEWEYDIIMYDARGHGLSEATEDGYTDMDRAADLAGLIQALGLHKPAIIGHSMGASTAALTAALYPELVGKLVLEDPPWRDDLWPDLAPEEAERRFEEERTRIIERKALSREALIARCRQECPTWDEAELGPWAESKRQLSPNVLKGFLQKPVPWREVVMKISCPTLLITADPALGALVTPEVAAEISSLNPCISVAHIGGAGHSVRREAFEEYIGVVRAFLKQE